MYFIFSETEELHIPEEIIDFEIAHAKSAFP